MAKQQDADREPRSRVSGLQSVLAGELAHRADAKTDQRLAAGASGGADEALAAIETKNSEVQHSEVQHSEAQFSEAQSGLDAANTRAARQREAERLDQTLKDAFGAIGQLRSALDNFITAIAPLGEAGAEAAAAAANFRETMRDSAAKAFDLGAQRKREIVASTKVEPQPAAGAKQAERRVIQLPH